ncbi:MAG TPA: hypothetical protein VIN07_00125 [Flavipsychrobacter sp.]
MLRAMILIMLGVVLLVVLLTQVLLPMMTDKLKFFWYFRHGVRDDIITLETSEKDELTAKAHSAKESYISAKKEIKDRRRKLDKLDKETNV